MILDTAIIEGVDKVGKTVVDGVDKIHTSDHERLEAENKRLVILSKALEKISDTNIAEAGHKSIFVAGWRPFIGWVCGVALAYNFLIHPIFEWVAAIWQPAVVAPKLDIGALITIITTMLGMAGLRTYEKQKGVARSTLKESQMELRKAQEYAKIVGSTVTDSDLNDSLRGGTF